MSDTPISAPPLPPSRKLIIALATIAMISGLLVAVTFQITFPIIALNKQRALEKAIFTVLPKATSHSNFLLEGDSLQPLSEEAFGDANVFAGYNIDNELVGLAMEASARGYQDVVTVLYAYSPASQCVVGITVLQSSETPGIGDKVETDPQFLKNFECLDSSLNDEGTALANAIVTVKSGKKTQPWQIDGISGATITSAAIGKALNQGANAMLPALIANQELLTANKGSE